MMSQMQYYDFSVKSFYEEKAGCEGAKHGYFKMYLVLGWSVSTVTTYRLPLWSFVCTAYRETQVDLNIPFSSIFIDGLIFSKLNQVLLLVLKYN